MSNKQIKNVVLSFIQKLPENFIIKSYKTMTAYADGSSDVFFEFTSDSKLPPCYHELYYDLTDQLKNMKENQGGCNFNTIERLLNKLKPSYISRVQMQKITKLKKLTFSEDDTSFVQDNTELEFQNGLVYVLNFWGEYGTLSEYEQGLEQISQVLEKNELWKEKVKLISLCHNQDLESMIKEMESQKWKSFEHYQLSSMEEMKSTLIDDLYKEYSNQPQFIILINKWGKIIFIGYLQGFDLETKLNELITAENDIDAYEEQQYNTDLAEDTLSKEQYKNLKKQMKQFQTLLGNAGFKKVFLKPDGTKIFHYSSQLDLNYCIPSQKLPEMNFFLENYWNQIPENLKEISQSNIKDEDNTIEKFKETFLSLGSEIYYEHNIQTEITLKKGEFDVHGMVDKALKAKNLNYTIYSSAHNILQKLSAENNFYQFDDLFLELKRNQLNLKQGQQFVPITNCKKFGENIDTQIEHELGKVMLIFISHYCLNYKYDIKYAAQLLEKQQEKWGKSVKCAFIVASNHENKELEIEDVEKYLKYFDLYNAQRNSSYYQCNVYQSTHPFCYIVDKFGTIRHEILYWDVETFVEDFIGEQKSELLEFEGQFTHETVENFLKFIQNEETKERIKKIDCLDYLKLEINFQQQKIGDQIKYKKPILNYTCRDFQVQDVNWVLQNIFQFIPEKKWKIYEEVQNTISVEYPGSVCAVCQKDILQQPQQYYSPFKKEHICVECAEFDDQTQTGSKRFKYLDTLIFINGPLLDLTVLKNIDVWEIGNNLQLQDGEEGKQPYIRCCGCDKPQGVRYIVLAKIANPKLEKLEFCQVCFFILKNKQSSRAKQIIKKNRNYGMTEDKLFLRVLFYYDDCDFRY